MQKVMVIGAGTMGSGIAQVLASQGVEVYLNDVDVETINKGIEKIDKQLNKLVSKEKIDSSAKDKIINKIRVHEKLEEKISVDLVIEAAAEDLNVKKQIFSKLSQVCPTETIFTTNTSAISITELANSTDRPEKFLGIHFFNPAPVMSLVEIIRGQTTDESIVNKCFEFTKNLDKEPIIANEAPGFVVNRILVPMINEAAFAVMEGVAAPEDIDKGMKLGANHPLGPLSLADMIGLDVCLSIMGTLHEELGDDKYRPCPLLRKLVRGGCLGKKSGKGFFSYQ